MTPELTPGQIVRYSRPESDEEHLTFTVIEVNDNRVLIESRDFPHWRIPPRETVSIDDIELDPKG